MKATFIGLSFMLDKISKSTLLDYFYTWPDFIEVKEIAKAIKNLNHKFKFLLMRVGSICSSLFVILLNINLYFILNLN